MTKTKLYKGATTVLVAVAAAFGLLAQTSLAHGQDRRPRRLWPGDHQSLSRQHKGAPVMGFFEKGRDSGPELLWPPARRFAPDVARLREISGLPMGSALRGAVRFLEDLAGDPAFVGVEIPSLLEEAEGAGNWYVARRYEESDYSLQVFVWPGGTGTTVHDHSSWGAYRCVAGSVLERRYARLDDGSRPEHARLRRAWQLRWTPEDGASTVLPGDGGIHSVTNVGSETSISVHLYGPRTTEIDGRDYDPSRDYVCDRMEDPEEAGERSTAA